MYATPGHSQRSLLATKCFAMPPTLLSSKHDWRGNECTNKVSLPRIRTSIIRLEVRQNEKCLYSRSLGEFWHGTCRELNGSDVRDDCAVLFPQAIRWCGYRARSARRIILTGDPREASPIFHKIKGGICLTMTPWLKTIVLKPTTVIIFVSLDRSNR